MSWLFLQVGNPYAENDPVYGRDVGDGKEIFYVGDVSERGYTLRRGKEKTPGSWKTKSSHGYVLIREVAGPIMANVCTTRGLETSIANALRLL